MMFTSKKSAGAVCRKKCSTLE